MSGPNTPGPDDIGSEHPEQDPAAQPTEPDGTDGVDEGGPVAGDEDAGTADESGTEVYPQAYSAPESEQITVGPYLPLDPSLYDYDAYDNGDEAQPAPPRWPWVVGVAAIIAAIALVVSVSLLVTTTDTETLATPATSTTTAPPPLPVQDEITTEAPPPPPPETTEPPPPPPPPETVTVTEAPPPPPPAPEPTEEAPPPAPETTTTTVPPTTTTTRSGPRQVTYSVTGTKAPGDIITITYTDAAGRSRTLRNVYIPWSLTVTPISQSEVGSLHASSLFLVSKLNCSITTSDGIVLSSNTSNSAQTSC